MIFYLLLLYIKSLFIIIFAFFFNWYVRIRPVIIVAYGDYVTVFFIYMLLENKEEEGIKRRCSRRKKGNIGRVWGGMIRRLSNVLGKCEKVLRNDRKIRRDIKNT